MNRFTCKSLIPALMLAGTTAFTAAAAELHGRVVDPSGAGRAGVEVHARAGDWRATVVTAADGALAIPLPEPLVTPVVVEVEAPGFARVHLEVMDPAVELIIPLEATFAGSIEVTGLRASTGSTPITVTDVDRDEIERGYWGQDVPVFLGQVPGFFATSDSGNGIGYSSFFLRGFDMRRTAVTLNGVPLNDAHSHTVYFIDHADFLATVGDIQVQRGVGTGLYGHSAIGGMVDLATRQPLPERRLRLTTALGSWDTSRWALELDSGRSDDGWAATARLSRVDTDGYRDQSWAEMWSYYGAVERLGARTTTQLVVFGGPERTHLAYEGVPKRYLEGEVTGDRRRDRRHNPLTYANEIDEFVQPHYQLHHTWQIGPGLTLRNVAYYFEGDGFYEQYKPDRYLPEYDLEPFPGPDGELVDTSDLVRRRQVDEWDAGLIPTLEWQHGGDRGLLQAGLATRWHSGRHWGETVWAENYPPATPPNHRYYDYRLDKRSLQPFVQESWRVDERWSLLAGVTWTEHRYEMSEDRRKGAEVREDFSFLLPRVGVSFRAAPTLVVFANVSRGGREPAFRDIYDPQDYWFGDPLDLEPEDLVDVELGGRWGWSTGAVSLNLYWMDFSSAIVFAGGLDSNGLPVTANGASLDARGIELELDWTPRPRWGAALDLAYSRSTFDHFTEYGWDGSLLDHSGNRVATSPDWIGSLQLYGGVGPVDLSLLVRHIGLFYLDNTEDQRLDPEQRAEPGYVARVNRAATAADLGVRIDLGDRAAALVAARRVTLDLRVTNVFDELYTTFGYVDGEEPVWIPAATRGVSAGVTIDW